MSWLTLVGVRVDPDWVSELILYLPCSPPPPPQCPNLQRCSVFTCGSSGVVHLPLWDHSARVVIGVMQLGWSCRRSVLCGVPFGTVLINGCSGKVHNYVCNQHSLSFDNDFGCSTVSSLFIALIVVNVWLLSCSVVHCLW